jgi:hypothetical protein
METLVALAPAEQAEAARVLAQLPPARSAAWAAPG